MFNQKQPTLKECIEKSKVYIGESSYIKSVKWKDINCKERFKRYLDTALTIKENINDYELHKNIENE